MTGSLQGAQWTVRVPDVPKWIIGTVTTPFVSESLILLKLKALASWIAGEVSTRQWRQLPAQAASWSNCCTATNMELMKAKIV